MWISKHPLISSNPSDCRLVIRLWRSTASPFRASHTLGPLSWSKQEATEFTCCCGPDRAWSQTTVSPCFQPSLQLPINHTCIEASVWMCGIAEFLYAHACVASLILLILSQSSSCAVYLPYFLCFLHGCLFSIYLSLPPLGLNSSSTLCFYMKPENH